MNASVDSVFPEKYRILSGSALKMIAVITMLIDHIGAVLLSMYQPAQKILFTLFGREYTVYLIFRDIGRAAFPIFCFLLLEGFRHTRSRFLYGRNLLLFALLSEIPWNLMFTNTLRYERQNVFFTLFLGYLAFCAIEYFQTRPSMQLLCILGLLVVSIFLKADYGWRGYIFLLIMYYMRDDKPGQAILGSCWLYYEWKACFAFLSSPYYRTGHTSTAFVFILIPPAPGRFILPRPILLHPAPHQKKAALSQKCSLNACPEESVSYFFFTISFAFL